MAATMMNEVSVGDLLLGDDAVSPPPLPPLGTSVSASPDAATVSGAADTSVGRNEGSAAPPNATSQEDVPLPPSTTSAVPPPPPPSSSLSNYLLRHGLVGVFDTMLGECAAATSTPQQQQQGDGSSNRACDAMLRVVGEAMHARCALGTKECVPPDVLNPSVSGATVASLRHHFSGKRILVLVELPQTVPQCSQGPNNAEEVGPSVLATYRLELICKSIVAIVTLGMGVAAGANPATPKVVLGFVLTNLEDASGGNDGGFGGSRKTKMPNASTLDSDDDDMDYDMMDAIMSDDDGGGTGASVSGAQAKPSGGPQVRTTTTTASGDGSTPYRRHSGTTHADGDDDPSFSGGAGSLSTSSTGGGYAPPTRSALGMLAAMLQGEGLEVNFLPSHTSLLQFPSSSSMVSAAPTAVAGGAAGDDLSDNGTAVSAPPSLPLSVSILPAVWAASAASSNPLSVFDPVLAFADAIVVEGLETLRLGHHPLFTYVPQSVGSAMLGVGAALEASAMRALLTGGSPGHPRLEFPGPSLPQAGRAAAALRAAASSSGTEGTGGPSSLRLLIVGDDEALCPRVDTNLPLTCPSALVHLVGAAEPLVYLFDTILLVGSAAMVLHRVQVRRRVAAAEEGEDGSCKIDWATPTEAAVSALLDAVGQYSVSIPGGCQVIGAEDFTFVKKTTSGKSKVEVLTAKTWNENDLFAAQRRAPQKFYYADAGPSTKAMLLAHARAAATVVGFGSLTRCNHHIGGSRAASMPYSAVVGEGDDDTASGLFSTTASAALIAQCRAQQTPLIVLGEHWAQAVANEAGAALPFAAGGYHFTPQQPTAATAAAVQLPVALQSRASGGGNGVARSPSPHNAPASSSGVGQRTLGGAGDASGTTTTTTAARGGLSRSVSDVHAHRRRQSSRSPDDRSLSVAAQLPRRVAPNCTYFLSKRVRKDRGPLQEECVHLATTPYREAGRILAGDCWEALKVLPCAVPTRSGGGGR